MLRERRDFRRSLACQYLKGEHFRPGDGFNPMEKSSVTTGVRNDINTLGLVSFGPIPYPTEMISVVLPDGLGAAFVRPCTSDVPVFQAIFQAKEYDVPIIDGSAEIIVDLGANTGLSGVYFATRCPRARIFAIEPSPHNFTVLRHNALSFPAITPIEAAIWNKDGVIYLEDHLPSGEALGDWAHRTVESSAMASRKVEAISMPTFMRRHGIREIDILKVDIEGAEYELFSSDYVEWLPMVKSLIIETHERFRPGVDDIVSRAISDFFVELEAKGENRVFRRRA